ncbi:MAG: hypothetical protein NZ821_10045 [Gloeomargarita sp. SKYB31]|nr:hypothetical protein [Gloeomargarita sp. SKYB31]
MPPVVVLTAKVRPDQLQQLDEIAQQRGISRGFLVRQIFGCLPSRKA